MKVKQVIKAILFVIIFLFLLQSVTYMLRTNGNIKEIFVGFYAEPEDTVDVILIGSSPVYPYYIAPQIWGEYGIACYPLSSNQQRPRAATYLVEEALKTQTPELFVFEMRQYIYPESTMMENMAFTRGATDNLKYSWNRFAMINDMVPEVSERYTYYFDIFKYHSNWKTIILPDQYTAFSYERLHPLKGYTVNTTVVPSEGKDRSEITEVMEIPEEQEEQLYRLLDYVKENELNALFIVSPMKLASEEQMKFNYIKSIVESYGYDFVNFNDYYEEIGIDFATDFYDDGTHTNTLGAEKCTAFFGAYLDQNYEFEDKRDDERYETWNAAYKYWQTCREEALQAINDKIVREEYGEIEVAE
ncbi:MAG: SGNH/GDSL hydrolase family protein [Lachnospiraceae bacterium]|nr:SGNH/GDSL hydrolase family protein [Lachnospiraceae bacterium]MBQ7782230.1 SGNH/GDSL hydrolase family protein [Lachnospiraceae bacterium]